MNKKTEKFAREISGIIKKNSIFTDSLNWEEIAAEIKMLPLGDNDSTNHSLLIKYYREKLREAGDRHSFFLTQRATSYLKNKTEVKKPTGKYLGEGIGYIKVPHCLTFDQAKDKEFANTIRNEIKKIDTSYTIVGWVVDFRQNFGGNMWPMLAGLNALMEDGTVGYFISPGSKKERAWVCRNGRINFPMRKIDGYKVKNLNTRIAILIDSMTASSGEMAVISFMGLTNVKVFGQPSAGLITANTTYQLSNGVELNLATTYVADRKKNPYLNKILPDIIIKDNPDSTSDETLEISKKWILQTGGLREKTTANTEKKASFIYSTL